MKVASPFGDFEILFGTIGLRYNIIIEVISPDFGFSERKLVDKLLVYVPI